METNPRPGTPQGWGRRAGSTDSSSMGTARPAPTRPQQLPALVPLMVKSRRSQRGHVCACVCVCFVSGPSPVPTSYTAPSVEPRGATLWGTASHQLHGISLACVHLLACTPQEGAGPLMPPSRVRPQAPLPHGPGAPSSQQEPLQTPHQSAQTLRAAGTRLTLLLGPSQDPSALATFTCPAGVGPGGCEEARPRPQALGSGSLPLPADSSSPGGCSLAVPWEVGK